MAFLFSYIKAERKSDCYLYVCHAGDEAEKRSEQQALQKEQKEDTATLKVIFKPFNLEKGTKIEIVLDDF